MAPAASPQVSRKQASNKHSSSSSSSDSVQTSIATVPVTSQHAVPADLDATISKPGVPRAVEVPSVEYPNGGPDAPKNGTPLIQHVAFFDTNQDGLITPLETLVGFRAIGFNIIFSFLAAIVIHSGFSYITQNSWIPDPLFRIRVANIHRGKHGSDSESYDTEGRFVPQKMEELFSKYDKEKKGTLTLKDLATAIYGNRNVLDFFGVFAAAFEWGTLWLLCQQDGKISREDVRSCLDGSLFYRMQQRHNEKKAKGQSHGARGIHSRSQ